MLSAIVNLFCRVTVFVIVIFASIFFWFGYYIGHRNMESEAVSKKYACYIKTFTTDKEGNKSAQYTFCWKNEIPAGAEYTDKKGSIWDSTVGSVTKHHVTR